jgi:hypothetical protein
MAAYTVSTGWAPVDRGGLNQFINATSATQLHALGERVVCRDTASTDYGFGEFIYLKGVASTVAGSVVLIKDDFSTSLSAARGKGAHAVACSANVANQYGWYQIKGKAMMAVGTCAANAPVHLGASGVGDTTVVAGDNILGARSVTAADTATAIVNLACNPVCGDFDNA